ncbi:hypothetical protein [Fimbriiglobus ruber]|uniref:hypothetical protein n=1 Tax=Fimbriiglobus ruber TaxID=1908690 RepID=UPI00117A4E31|nr:hypothetical protein [Fimbriiglobus ruber]
MTVLAAIALEFCQTCLGWSDIAWDSPVSPDEPGRVYGFSDPEKTNFSTFVPTDLNAVFTMARSWCQKNSLDWQMTEDRDGLHVRLTDHFGSVLSHLKAKYFIVSNDLAHAVLVASVAACRKLNATNSTR